MKRKGEAVKSNEVEGRSAARRRREKAKLGEAEMGLAM